ncbi:acetyltransferase (GNAT) family protein [Agromyces ramosus]|jgi:GNAT superfamily N-acetyltransferase|uniref:Acetyltransferase (GNAT) family protein n=1 Tax=Agromyces ramosus TaxID=33879 RepID=A0A4Q7MHI3_9MICO|nr:GNAT family N-acetyltransferase [Agromyces ramosus]RZS67651.1 acetyltransferase (GNAT) family protein [Agromyces ramosus]
MRFREVDVTGAEALTLLDAYFAERAAGFPAAQGAYRPTYPMAEQFTPPAGVFLVVEDDGGVIGCGGVRRIQRRPETNEVRFEVKHLWLAPAARGRGAGRLLLEELERRAVEFGAQELVLDTNASLEAAGGLYRSSGYGEIEPYNANPNATHWFGKRVG